MAKFGLILTANGIQLASYSQPKSGRLSPSDFLLLANFVEHTPQLRSEGKTWTPLCLPNYNATGHMQAYCTPLGSSTILLLLTLDSSLDNFHACAQRHEMLRKTMQESGLEYLLDNKHPGLTPKDFDCPAAMHLCCVHRDTRLFVETTLMGFLSNKKHRKTLVRRYAHVLSLLDTSSDEIRIVWDATHSDMAVLVCTSREFSILGIFPPLMLQSHAAAAAARARAYCAKNVDELFLV